MQSTDVKKGLRVRINQVIDSNIEDLRKRIDISCLYTRTPGALGYVSSCVHDDIWFVKHNEKHAAYRASEFEVELPTPAGDEKIAQEILSLIDRRRTAERSWRISVDLPVDEPFSFTVMSGEYDDLVYEGNMHAMKEGRVGDYKDWGYDTRGREEDRAYIPDLDPANLRRPAKLVWDALIKAGESPFLTCFNKDGSRYRDCEYNIHIRLKK